MSNAKRVFTKGRIVGIRAIGWNALIGCRLVNPTKVQFAFGNHMSTQGHVIQEAPEWLVDEFSRMESEEIAKAEGRA